MTYKKIFYEKKEKKEVKICKMSSFQIHNIFYGKKNYFQLIKKIFLIDHLFFVKQISKNTKNLFSEVILVNQTNLRQTIGVNIHKKLPPSNHHLPPLHHHDHQSLEILKTILYSDFISKEDPTITTTTASGNTQNPANVAKTRKREVDLE